MTDAVRSYAREHQQDFLEQLIEFLSIPSISTLQTHTDDCTRAAEWIARRMQSIHLENVEVIHGAGHPLVYADWMHAKDAPTVLLYGHYDVQPTDPDELWVSAPFQPEIREGYIYARGAVDDKGQVAALLNAAEAYLCTRGSLPVNLRLLIEGEEESGGQHIKEFVNSRDHRLDADFAHVSDSAFFAHGVPSICTGLRGIVYTEVTVRTARGDLHSGQYGGIAPNPFISLAHIISRLRDGRGNITIPGFFDEVATPPPEVLQSWRDLDVTTEAAAAEVGAVSLIGDSDLLPLERMWSRPTLDVHGMPGGFMGEGAKTVIPAVASAKISMRIVPNQRAERVFEAFKSAVLRAAPDDAHVDVRLIHADDPVLIPVDGPELKAAALAVEKVWHKAPVFDRSGGSIPIVGIFLEELGIPSVLLGYGLPDDNLHAPNERFLLEQFYGGIETNIVFWDLVAQN